MKIKIILFLAILTLGGLTESGYSQPPPPPPSNGHGLGGNQPPASAPVGSGTYILLVLAAVYTFRKVYILRTDAEVE